MFGGIDYLINIDVTSFLETWKNNYQYLCM